LPANVRNRDAEQTTGTDASQPCQPLLALALGMPEQSRPVNLVQIRCCLSQG
jgi:hypothetical protein